MKHRLTKVEYRFVRATHTPKEIRMEAASATWRRELREYMTDIAFHEAGHMAAQGFARDGNGWTSGASQTTKACIDVTRTSLGHVDVADGGAIGYAQLLDWLAGYVVDRRRKEAPYCKKILDPSCGDWTLEGTDLFNTEQVAKIMERPGMSARRILNFAEKWTVEMLERPDVWRCVEKLAKMLLERGTIEADLILAVQSTMTPARELPKWKRRLTIKKGSFET